MKGLLIKDYRFLFLQKKFYMTILLIGVLMLFSGADSEFVSTYLTFIVAYFTISTISYDEFDNGMSFLMTLPITRKEYIKGKYVYAFINTVVTWLAANVLISVIMVSKGKQSDILGFLIGELAVLAVIFIMLSITIPVSIIFGASKGRVAMVGIFGALYLVTMFIGKIVESISLDIRPIINALISQNPVVICLECAVVCLAVLAVSYIVSVRYISKKQF